MTSERKRGKHGGLRNPRSFAPGTLVISLVALVVAAACGEHAPLSSQNGYEERLRELDARIWSKIGVSWEYSASSSSVNEELRVEAKRLRDYADLAGRVAEEARQMRPPSRYAKGHAQLVDFYRRSQVFLQHEANSIDRQILGEDTVLLKQEGARLFDQLLNVRARALQLLPFLSV